MISRIFFRLPLLAGRLQRDGFKLNHNRALDLWWSMIPRVKPEGMLFGKPVSTFPDHALEERGALDESLVDRYLSVLLMRSTRGIGCANWLCKLGDQPCRP